MTTKSSAKSSPRTRTSSTKSHAKASTRPAAKSRATRAPKTTRASTKSSHAAKTTVRAAKASSHATTATPAHEHLVLQPQPPMESSLATALTDSPSAEPQVESLRATSANDSSDAREPLSDSLVQSLPQRLDEFRAVPAQVRDIVVERVGEVRSQIGQKLDAIKAWPRHALQSVKERASEIPVLRRFLSPSEAEPAAAE